MKTLVYHHTYRVLVQDQLVGRIYAFSHQHAIWLARLRWGPNVHVPFNTTPRKHTQPRSQTCA